LTQLLRGARNRLAEAGIGSPELETRLIVEHFTGMSRADAIVRPDTAIGPETVAAIAEALRRRLAGEPVHRILGHREFYGLKLDLSAETLEPRPDTETLVDLVLPFVRETVARHGVCSILDLGTGTGAVALAILSQVPQANAVGTDVSDDALATATRNAERLGLGSRFTALKSDWFEKIVGRVHAIVSNPPYIRRRDIARLAREVRDFDPLRALDGGEDGLEAYRIITGRARSHLVDDGNVAVEFGYDQKDDVAAIFKQGGYRPLGDAKDLGGNDRAMAFGP